MHSNQISNNQWKIGLFKKANKFLVRSNIINKRPNIETLQEISYFVVYFLVPTKIYRQTLGLDVVFALFKKDILDDFRYS